MWSLAGVAGELRQLPFTVAQWARGSGLDPAANAVVVEGVVAHTPTDLAVVALTGDLVDLALDAQVRDIVLANGAVLYLDVPAPHADGVVLLGLHLALATIGTEVCAIVGHLDLKLCAVKCYAMEKETRR